MFADRERLVEELQQIEDAGLWKQERLITGPQGVRITTEDGEVLNFCANNYLGLSSHPAILEAAHAALDSRPIHLWNPGHSQATGSSDLEVSVDRGHHPLHILLRCQRRSIRDFSGS